MPLQLVWPVGQQTPSDEQVPEQGWQLEPQVPVAQAHVLSLLQILLTPQSLSMVHWTQVPLLHFDVGLTHGLQVVPSALQVAGWEMSTQVVPPQSPFPAGHLHCPFEQVVPPVQAWPHIVVPQLLLSEFLSTQLVPHIEVVLSHAVPQTLLVQVATVWAPAAVQSEAAQQAGAEILMQVVLPGQVCCPLGHVPLQAAFCAIHAPLQFCGRFAGQL